MNGERYMKVLQEKLFPWMERLGATKFLQDGTLCHTNKVMALLKERRVIIMDWLGNLPDIHPIENVRAIVKARLQRVPNITLLPPWERAIKIMWVKDLPISLMKKLAHSMPKRIQMCI
jgi:hypothetical protein